MRYPAVAGQFYPSNEKELDILIRELYMHPLGPGEVSNLVQDGIRRIKGGVVPHAGYVFSGPVAAHFYHSLAKDGFPESFIIIGPNHYGIGSPVALTLEDFITPYGVARVDKELAKELVDMVDIDSSAHKYEHSIEVQLPFLQFLKREIKFVPITMLSQEYEIAVELGKVIREAIDGRDVVVVASSDFSHYVPKDVAYKNDSRAIEKILKRDIKGLYEVIYQYNITMCGYGPVAAMLTATKGRGKLLRYATSGDVQDMNEVVGYAAIKVE